MSIPLVSYLALVLFSSYGKGIRSGDKRNISGEEGRVDVSKCPFFQLEKGKEFR